MTLLEKIQSRPLPFAALMGVTFTEALQDRVTATLKVREDLCTLGDAIHGGAVMAFADTVAATLDGGSSAACTLKAVAVAKLSTTNTEK